MGEVFLIEVLYPKFPGLILICEGCGCLLRYDLTDIYDSYVYCPRCRIKNKVEIYDEKS